MVLGAIVGVASAYAAVKQAKAASKASKSDSKPKQPKAEESPYSKAFPVIVTAAVFVLALVVLRPAAAPVAPVIVRRK